MKYVEVIRNGQTISKHHQGKGYGSIGQLTSSSSIFKTFHTLIYDLVIPKVISIEGNKVIKVATPLIDGFECYYTTFEEDVIICFTEDNVPRFLPLRLLTELRKLNNENDEILGDNINDILNNFNEELLSYHGSKNIETTEQGLQEIIEIMNDNIDKFLQRQEHVSLLVDKTSQLNQSSYNFQKRAVKLKKKMWWNNVKIYTAIVSIVIILILLGILIYFQN